MNIRKTIDYSAMYTELDELMGKSLPQMELYREIGRLVCSRAEKGAAVMASEYLRKNYSDTAGFSPRNVRRMREFFRTYEGNETLMIEAVKIGWTQNVLIMERCVDNTERQWYLQAVSLFGWTKLELAAKIDDEAHLNMTLASQEEIYNTENRRIAEANNAERSHKFAAALSDGFRVPLPEEPPYLRPKARGHPNRYRWDYYKIEPYPQKLNNIRSVNCWLKTEQLTLHSAGVQTNEGASENEKELFYVCKGSADHAVDLSSGRCTQYFPGKRL